MTLQRESSDAIVTMVHILGNALRVFTSLTFAKWKYRIPTRQA